MARLIDNSMTAIVTTIQGQKCLEIQGETTEGDVSRIQIFERDVSREEWEKHVERYLLPKDRHKLEFKNWLETCLKNREQPFK